MKQKGIKFTDPILTSFYALGKDFIKCCVFYDKELYDRNDDILHHYTFIIPVGTSIDLLKKAVKYCIENFPESTEIEEKKEIL